MRHGRGTGANENDDDMGYANGFRAVSPHYHTVNTPAASQRDAEPALRRSWTDPSDPPASLVHMGQGN